MLGLTSFPVTAGPEAAPNWQKHARRQRTIDKLQGRLKSGSKEGSTVDDGSWQAQY